MSVGLSHLLSWLRNGLRQLVQAPQESTRLLPTHEGSGGLLAAPPVEPPRSDSDF